MGRRGPAAEPTALKLIKGGKKNRINTDEPVPPAGPMVAPRWLSSYAREEWDAVCGQLEAMGTVAPCDTTALSCYCEAVARWRKLTEVVTVSPPAFEVNGVLVKNPTYSQMRDAEIAVRLFAREFGLTPSARAGIRVTVNLNTEGAGRLLSH